MIVLSKRTQRYISNFKSHQVPLVKMAKCFMTIPLNHFLSAHAIGH